MQKTHNDTTNRVVDTTPTSSTPSTTAINGVALPACASCRHQRKKCTQNCVLAPFFPAEKTQDFQMVHKVFGVSNVTKLVKGLSREDAKKAVDSLIWEANCRANDPVLGPFGEFQRVCEELKFYKTQYQVTNRVNRPNVHQGASLYNNNKPTHQRVIGSWTNGDHNNGINNGSMMGYIDNSRMFNFGSTQNMERSLKQERDQEEHEGSLFHPQQLMNEYSDQFNY